MSYLWVNVNQCNKKRREEKNNGEICLSLFSNGIEQTYEIPNHVKAAIAAGLDRKKCTRCGRIRLHGNYDIHHIDGDHYNNSPENLTILCRHCHICTTFDYASDEDGIIDERSWELEGVIREDV